MAADPACIPPGEKSTTVSPGESSPLAKDDFYGRLFASVLLLAATAGSTLSMLALWSDSIHEDIGNERLLYTAVPGALMSFLGLCGIPFDKVSTKEKLGNVVIVLLGGFLMTGFSAVLLQEIDHPGKKLPVVSALATICWLSLCLTSLLALKEVKNIYNERNATSGASTAPLLGGPEMKSASDGEGSNRWAWSAFWTKPYDLATKAGVELQEMFKR